MGGDESGRDFGSSEHHGMFGAVGAFNEYFGVTIIGVSCEVKGFFGKRAGGDGVEVSALGEVDCFGEPMICGFP